MLSWIARAVSSSRTPGQRVAIVFVIVNDQERIGGRAHGSLPFGSRARTFPSSLGNSTGLVS